MTTVIVLSLAAFGSYALAQDGAGSGQGPSAAFVPAGAATAMNVQVIGQQWAFTYRYPSYGGIETPHLVLPANTLDPATRHLARRRPLLLGLRARREGRCESRRRQHRLREAQWAAELPAPLRRALRALARLHVRHRPGRDPGGVQDLDRAPGEALRADPEVPAALRALLPARLPTTAPDEAAPPHRLPPRHRARVRRRSAGTSAGGSATRSAIRASTTSRTSTRTTSRSSSATCSAPSASSPGSASSITRSRASQADRRRCRRPAGRGATSGWRPTTRSSGSSTCGASGSSSSSGA